MAVKRSQSASRVLSVFELIAAHQPIGVSALAKLLADDRSAVQRAVMTLADAGWIRLALEPPVRWELSAHIFTMAHLPDSMIELRQRTRGVLDSLREQTGETSFLAIPDLNRFVVIELAESPHTLRMALRVGQVIGPRESATGRAFLPYLDARQQAAMLGQAPDEKDLAEFAATRARGYGLSAGESCPGRRTWPRPSSAPTPRPSPRSSSPARPSVWRPNGTPRSAHSWPITPWPFHTAFARSTDRLASISAQ